MLKRQRRSPTNGNNGWQQQCATGDPAPTFTDQWSLALIVKAHYERIREKSLKFNSSGSVAHARAISLSFSRKNINNKIICLVFMNKNEMLMLKKLHINKFDAWVLSFVTNVTHVFFIHIYHTAFVFLLLITCGDNFYYFLLSLAQIMSLWNG